MEDHKLSKKAAVESDSALGAELDRLAKEKSDWMDRLARHYFPDHIYQLAKERRRQSYVAKWLEAQGYEVIEVPEEMLTQFCRMIDGKLTVLAEFQIEMRGKSA